MDFEKVDIVMTEKEQQKYNIGVMKLPNGMLLWLGFQYHKDADIRNIILSECDNLPKLLYEILITGEDFVYDEAMYNMEVRGGIKPCFQKYYCGYTHIYAKITADYDKAFEMSEGE